MENVSTETKPKPKQTPTKKPTPTTAAAPAPKPEQAEKPKAGLDLSKPVKIGFVRFCEAITVMTHTAPSIDAKAGVASGRIEVELAYYPGLQLLAVHGRKKLAGDKYETETELVVAANIKQMRVA